MNAIASPRVPGGWFDALGARFPDARSELSRVESFEEKTHVVSYRFREFNEYLVGLVRR